MEKEIPQGMYVHIRLYLIFKGMGEVDGGVVEDEIKPTQTHHVSTPPPKDMQVN
jgi:hypothetical protein